MPLAILGAGALVGAGLYFGLRARPTSEARGPGSAAAPVQAASPTSLAASAPRVDVAARREALRAAIEARRPELVARCAKADAGQSEQVWNGTVAADGTPIAFSVLELRGRTVPAVAACAQGVLATLRLPPAVESAYLEVPFTLP